MAIRVLVADDHPMMRAGMRAMLAGEAGIEVVAEAGDGATAVRAVEEWSPDVVIIDVRLPDMNGAEAVARIRRHSPAIRFVMVSAYADHSTVSAASRAGASAFVPKDAVFEELGDAVRAVGSGGSYSSPTLRRILAGGG